jgi:DNA invertase Pin-like site-specific DNA recombinase
MSHQSTTRRGVVYGRKSTDQQKESIEQQLEWAEEACPREKLTIVATFTDSAKSGHATAKRTDFHRMLVFCQEEQRAGRPIDVLVCWHPNRFSRADSQETGWYLWEFRKAGVTKMFTAQRWIDFESMQDRTLLGIEQELSNHKYSIDLAESSTRGKLARAREGLWCGGRVPYGYRMTFKPAARPGDKPIPDVLVPDPASAAVVRWLFDSYATGRYSLRMLVQELNDRREPTPTQWAGERRRGRDGHRHQGRPYEVELWTVPTVRALLVNEVYLGHLIWNRTHQGRFFGVVDLKVNDAPGGPARTTKRNDPKDYVRGAARHEALTTLETFALCQRRLVQQQKCTTPRRGGTGLLLTGLLYCAHCERRMVGRHKARTSQKDPTPLYLCGSYLQYGKARCAYNSVLEAPLVAAIATKLRERFTPAFFDRCREMLLSEVPRGRTEDEGARLARDLKDMDEQLARAARRALTEPDDSLALTYREQAKQLQQQRDRLAADLDAARRAAAPQADPATVVDRAVELIAGFEGMLARGTPAEVRAILRDHIEKVELWFTHEEKGRETRCTFARGLVWLHADSPLAACLSTSDTSR